MGIARSVFTANMTLEQEKLVVRKNVQFGSSLIGLRVVASLKLLFSSLTVNTETET